MIIYKDEDSGKTLSIGFAIDFSENKDNFIKSLKMLITAIKKNIHTEKISMEMQVDMQNLVKIIAIKPREQKDKLK